MAPLIPSGPTPDEELATVTPEEIELLTSKFHQLVKEKNSDFDKEDLERVNTDKLWLRRFIAHSEFKLDEAVKMLFETCQWRKEFGTNQMDHTKLPAHVLEKGILFIRNRDKWGKTLLMFKAKHHQKGVEDFEVVKKFIVYYFERIERASQSEQISIIFDMKDTGWSNMDMDFIRYLITLLKQYYPFFVNYLIIYEMPWLLKSAWNIIKGWLPAKFVERVKFLDKKTISEFIDADNQLVEWGGNDEYVYKFEPEVRTKRQPTLTAEATAPKVVVTNGNAGPQDSGDSSPKEDAVVRRRAPQPKPASLQVKAQVQRQEQPPPPTPTQLNLGSLNGSTTNHVQVHDDNDSSSEDEGGDGMTTSPVSRSPTPSSPAQTPRVVSRIPTEDEANVAVDRSLLVKVDSVVKFEKEGRGADINGRFNIESIANGTMQEPVLFKVKTTDPSKFRVRPTIGVLDGDTISTVVHINVLEGVTLHHIGRERFQVQATVLPKEYRSQVAGWCVTPGADATEAAGNRSSGSNYTQLNNVWKQIVGNPDVYLETHRMTCRLDPSALPQESSGEGGSGAGARGASTINKEDTKRALDQLEQKITTSFNSTLNEKFDYIIKLIYGLFLFVLFATFILWLSIPSAVRTPSPSA